MAAVHLVCEGRKDSLDARVLNATLALTLRVRVTISGAGGGTSLGSVAAWIEEESRDLLPNGSFGRPNAVALYIEDRNFCPRPEAEAPWSRPDAKGLIWRRHEIESYLLEPAVVLAAFQTYRRDVADAWVKGLPNDVAGVTALLAALAGPLLEDHAGQLLLWELRVAKGKAGVTDFSKKAAAPPAGTPYPGRSEWLSELVSEAARLQRDCLAVSALSSFAAAAIETRYDAVLADLRRPEFSRPDSFLFDMAGKRLLKTLYQHLRANGAPLAYENFEDDLVEALMRTYQPDATFQPDEFKMLADRLMRLGMRMVP